MTRIVAGYFATLVSCIAILTAGKTQDALSQQITISGPLQVQDQLQVEGKATISKEATMNGGATVNGGAYITGGVSILGGATIGGGAAISGTIQSSEYGVVKSPVVTLTGPLKGGDKKSSSEIVYNVNFCALSLVSIAGEDEKISDSGSCSARSKNPTTWEVTAVLGGRTDEVKCEMICLALPFAALSENKQGGK